MTTWKWFAGWTWITAASTGLGKAVGFTVGGPHGPGLIVSHHSRSQAEIRPPAALIQAVRQANRVCQEALTAQHPAPRSHTRAQYSSIIRDRERVADNAFLFPCAVWIRCQFTCELLVAVTPVTVKVKTKRCHAKIYYTTTFKAQFLMVKY